MVSRRRFLRSVGVAGLASVVGCNSRSSWGNGDSAGAAPSVIEAKAVNDRWSQFGQALALDDGVLVVGARAALTRFADHGGAAFVYEHEAGDWVKQARLRPKREDMAGAFEDARLTFGSHVAVENGIVVVASAFAPLVYTYERRGGEWVRTTAHYPLGEDNENGDIRGFSFDGRKLAVGVLPENDETETADPRVFVYEYAGGTLQETAAFRGRRYAGDDGFGTAVTVDGDSLAVFSRDYAGDEPTKALVHVFRRVDSTWRHETVLEPSAGLAGSVHRNPYALRDDTLVVSALERKPEPSPHPGVVEVYRRTDGDWSRTATIKAEQSSDWGQFGAAVALADDAFVVGSDPYVRDDDEFYGEDDLIAGRVHTYERSGGEWTRERVLPDSDAVPSGYVGEAVAISEDHVAFRAKHPRENRTQRAAVYVFDR
jgi:hypothetical protein